MKFLITGGAGFIGINFLQYMRETHPEDQLICLDKLTYAANIGESAKLVEQGVCRLIEEDITNREGIFDIFNRERPDVVVNFAAESHVDRSIAQPDLFLQTNVMGTQILLDGCLRFDIPRFHQISTDEVYGDLPLNRPDLRFDEDSPLCPSSPYSASKAAADLLVQAYHRTYQLPVSISRCSNNYGPHQHREKFIPQMIAQGLAGGSMPLYGDGKNIRDWIHVRDHCAAIDLILRQNLGENQSAPLYNIGGDCEKSNLELAQLIAQTLGRGEITFVADRPGHDRRYAVDWSKIARELGWRPEISLESGLSQLILDAQN